MATNTVWVRTRFCKLQTKRCTRLAATSDKAYQLLAHGRWFSLGTPKINQSINHVIRANHLVSLITSSTTDPSCLAIVKLKIYSKELKTIHFSSFSMTTLVLQEIASGNHPFSKVI
jgi:organic radical activating enzyme